MAVKYVIHRRRFTSIKKGKNMFDSIYNVFQDNFFAGFFIMLASALVAGFLFSFIASFKVRSNKRFFVIASILPAVIAIIASITSMNAYWGAAIAVSGAFGLIRFRSAQGSAEEIGVLAIELAAGFAFGLGYLAVGAIVIVALGLIFLLLSEMNIFEHKTLNEDKILRVTIPENLDYGHVFDEEFKQFCKSSRLVRAKTINMGSMYRLEYEITLKNVDLEKAFLDAVRIKNGNLEVSLTEAVRVAGEL